MPHLSRLIAPMVLLLGGILAACAPTLTPQASAPPEPVRGPGLSQPLTVAFLAPKTSPDQDVALLGQALVNAAQMAMRDVNDPLLDLRIYDTGGDPARAKSVAGKAVANGAHLILGPLFSASASAVAPVAAAANVNVISFSTNSSVAGGPVFLSGILPGMAADRIIGFAKARGFGPIGVLYPETSYGQAALAGAEAAAGSALVARASYARTSQAIPPATRQFATDVHATGARGLLLADSGQGLRYVAALLAAEGLDDPNHRFLGLGTWDTRSTLDSPELTGAWFASTDPAALRSFVGRYRASYGAVPPRLAFLGYDAVRIAGQLLDEARRTGATAPFSRGAITRPQGFDGAVGPIRFLSNGTNRRGLAILEVGEHVFNVVDPTPTTFGAGS